MQQRGRPREFDMTEAVDKAIPVFCEYGYQAASISTLSEAMQLTPGSIYKAFNDKHGLFIAAFDRYKAMRHELLQAQIATGLNGKERIYKTLKYFADSACTEKGILGCLVVGSAIGMTTLETDLQARVIQALKQREQLLIDLLKQGQQDGSISPHPDLAATAKMLLCLIQGICVIGKAGCQKDEMDAMINTAMQHIA